MRISQKGLSVSLKEIIKNTGMSLAPQFTMEILSARSQKLIMRLEAADGRVDASRQYAEKYGATVTEGPFVGMTYPAQTVSERNLINKFLGVYEDQLHPWIKEAIGYQPHKIINIGAADGYYTVGLAMQCPQSTVIAFDTDSWARHATKALASENHIDNVQVKSYCDTRWLEKNVDDGTLLLVDCEGGEEVLLDTRKAPRLAKASIIVELHEHVVPNLKNTITERFSHTHDIRSVPDRDRSTHQHKSLEFLTQAMRQRVLSEGRSWAQTWLYLVPKSSSESRSQRDHTRAISGS